MPSVNALDIPRHLGHSVNIHVSDQRKRTHQLAPKALPPVRLVPRTASPAGYGRDDRQRIAIAHRGLLLRIQVSDVFIV
jgi:hypothetical protein